jgi:hypothetical protein
MPSNMSSSPLVAALDPRVDEQVVQDQMLDGNPAEVSDDDPVDPGEQGPRP